MKKTFFASTLIACMLGMHAQKEFKALTNLTTFSNNDCSPILKDGLYQNYKIINTGSFQQDIKTYFSSSEFENDYKAGKWSGGVSLGPLSLGGHATDDQIHQFQKSVTQTGSLSIDNSFFEKFVISIPDVGLAAEYRKCIENASPYGFKVTADIGDFSGMIKIRFIKETGTPNPKVTNLTFSGISNVNTSIKVGDVLAQNEYVISFMRNPGQEVLIALETTRGIATYREDGEAKGNMSSPVGMIVASVLNYESFCETNGESNHVWSQKSKWAPCDGREVTSSKYGKISNSVPDLRGVFLRGLNNFKVDGAKPINVSQAECDASGNPIDRAPGNFEADGVGPHQHHYTKGELFANADGGNERTYHGARDPDIQTTDCIGCASETRPKNIVIFYYIKINP